MKKLIITITLISILTGCSGVKKDEIAEEDSAVWNEVTFKNHKYIKVDDLYALSIVHSPDCECKIK